MRITEKSAYTAFGAIDQLGRAYVAFRPRSGAEPVAAMRLNHGSTLIHAELRAAQINARGPIVLTLYSLVPHGQLPVLFEAPE